MNNYLLTFDEKQNPIVWLPSQVPKGQLESYLKFLDKREKEGEKDK